MKIPKGSVVTFKKGEREIYIWLTLKDLTINKKDVLICADIREAYPDFDRSVLTTCKIERSKNGKKNCA